MTRRKYKEYWTEVKRVVNLAGEPFVKQTTCCCGDPGGKRKDCAKAMGNKTPCRWWIRPPPMETSGGGIRESRERAGVCPANGGAGAATPRPRGQPPRRLTHGP